MNQLKNYIQKNLSIYEDDNYILNQLFKVNITPLEQLYNAYNRSLIKKYGIYFDKYNVISLKDNDLSLNKEDKIKILEISKSKKYIAVSFSNLKIYIFELIEAKHDNNDIFNINLISIFDVINNKDENNEVNLINFSYDEKNLSVLINNSTLNIYDIFTGEIIRTFNKEIIYFIENWFYI
jgi:WD40 repeat protein